MIRVKQGVKFIFERGVLQKKFYIRNAFSSMRKLNELFPFPLAFIVINVFLNRISFLNAIHKKSAPSWLIAYVPKKSNSNIYLLSKGKPLLKQAVSYYRQVLTHEVAHLYTNALNPNLPDWLKEGISIYVAGQIFKTFVSSADWKKISKRGVPFEGVSWKFAAEHNGYIIAGLLVVFSVRRYGWARFIAALKSNRRFSLKSIISYFDEKPVRFIADFKDQFVK